MQVKNPPIKNALTLLLLPVAILLTACNPAQSSDKASNASSEEKEHFATIKDYLPLTINGKEIQVQVAITSAEQAKGLMNRDSLETDHGMIFLFQRPRQMSFWMRNTRIPLDIGYITADGVLREVHDMKPYDETPVPSLRSDIQFALEMSKSWYIKNGIRPGMEIDRVSLEALIEQRGYALSEFGL